MSASETPAIVPIDDDRLERAEKFIEAEEGATSRFRGWLGLVTTTLLVVMSVFHLYAAVEIVPAQVLRPVHVGFTLLLVFLLFPIAARYRKPEPAPAGTWRCSTHGLPSGHRSR